jgi:hypothetical protein
MLTIDYGSALPEVFVLRGKLMSYGQHTATEGVLDDPDARGLTAHVNSMPVEGHGRDTDRTRCASRPLPVRCSGAAEQEFTRVLTTAARGDAIRRWLQRKSRLFEREGDVLGVVAGKTREQIRREKPVITKKAPENRGLGVEFVCPFQGTATATSFSSEQPSSSWQPFWLRSSSIDSP